MKKNGCIQFPYFFDLLTPKEKKAYKLLIINYLLGVNFGVNLRQFGIHLTQKGTPASTLKTILTQYILYCFSIFYKTFFNIWRQTASNYIFKIDAV